MYYTKGVKYESLHTPSADQEKDNTDLFWKSDNFRNNIMSTMQNIIVGIH